jgi:hypothetical protein
MYIEKQKILEADFIFFTNIGGLFHFQHKTTRRIEKKEK